MLTLRSRFLALFHCTEEVRDSLVEAISKLSLAKFSPAFEVSSGVWARKRTGDGQDTTFEDLMNHLYRAE